MLLRVLVFSLVIITSMSSAFAESFKKYKHHTQYDTHFRKYSKHYFGPAFDWHHFKAQAIAESNLNPDARSWVGAQGIMQIMPRTFSEIQRKNKWNDASAKEPRWNIAAAIWYNKGLFDFWKKGRSLSEQLRFMFASYNAGKSNLLKAQRVAINEGLNPKEWQSISKVLERVTGKHSKETIHYVTKIEHIKQEIK